MKRIALIAIVFCMISLNGFSYTIKIGYIAPLSGKLSILGETFLHGMQISLDNSTELIVKDSNNNIAEAYNDLIQNGVDIIVGPFTKQNVSFVNEKTCSSGKTAILPMFYPDNACSGAIGYRYDPVEAARQLANIVCESKTSNLLVLYALELTSLNEKNAFLEKLHSCGINPDSEGFLSGRKTYNSYFKHLFMIHKRKHIKSLTDKETFKYYRYRNIKNVVIFSNQSDFIKFANLFNYYDIKIKRLFTTGIFTDSSIYALDKHILKKITYITPYYQYADNGKNLYFRHQYSQKYNQNPNQIAALGFDIGTIINSINTKDIYSYLKSIKDFYGLIGHLFFFDDAGRGVFEYRIVNYNDIKERQYELQHNKR